MPKVRREDIPFPEFDQFERSLYRGRGFRALVLRLVEDIHLCENPVAYSRVLQNMLRPTWSIEYRPGAADYRTLAHGLLASLEQLNAPVLFHSWANQPEGTDHIRMSYHSVGHKKNRWHYKVGYLPDFINFDQGGFSGWSDLYALDPEKLQRYPDDMVDTYFETISTDYRENLKSKYKQAKREDVAEDNFVFIPMQVVNDVVMSLKLFPQTYLEAIKIVVRRLSEAGHTVVLKRHPMCKDAGVTDFIGSVPSDRVIVSNASVHTLLPKAKCVVMLNSGVGFEALMYLKPIVCLGKSDYNKAGVELDDPDAIVPAVERAIATKDDDLIKRVVFAALNIYQIDTRSPEAFDRQVLRALGAYYMASGPR